MNSRDRAVRVISYDSHVQRTLSLYLENCDIYLEDIMQGNESEVARLLHQIDLEYQAAQQGLTGVSAGTAQHAFITAKMENIGVYREQLATYVGEVQATQLVCELAEQHIP